MTQSQVILGVDDSTLLGQRLNGLTRNQTTEGLATQVQEMK